MSNSHSMIHGNMVNSLHAEKKKMPHAQNRTQTHIYYGNQVGKKFFHSCCRTEWGGR